LPGAWRWEMMKKNEDDDLSRKCLHHGMSVEVMRKSSVTDISDLSVSVGDY
jgi:hypothetical protein